MTATIKKIRPLLAVAALAVAACTPAATLTAEAPTPAVSIQPTEEAMPEEPTEVMEEPTEMMEEPMEAMEEPTEMMEEPAGAMLTGDFVKEEVPVTGSYSLDPASGKLTFSDDFSVSAGPDLYVLLSAADDLSLDYQTFGTMVVNSPKLSLAALASDAGGQSYTIPSGTDLSQYNTIVIWCQSFSVAFAAAPLAQ